MADLVTAVGMGTASRFISVSQITTAPMTVLPLSLIPTFAVPLFFVLHIISIAQARRWKETMPVGHGELLPGTAV